MNQIQVKLTEYSLDTIAILNDVGNAAIATMWAGILANRK